MNGREAASLLFDDGVVPRECDTALVLRHAQREEIPVGSFGEDVRLTLQGIKEAERLGELISERLPGRVVSSPIQRCIATAQAISRGAGWSAGVATDSRLGKHGPFVSDPNVSGRLFMEIGISEIVRRQLLDDQAPPGFRDTSEGIRNLLDFTSQGLGCSGRLNIYVTHDAILAALVGWLFRLPVYQEGWPNFLDGVLLWQRGGKLRCAWRELQQTAHPLGR